MKALLNSFELQQQQLGRATPVHLYRGADRTNAEHIERDWKQWFAQTPGAQDAHWEWDEKLLRAESDPLLYDVFVLEAENTTQAVMLVMKGGLKCSSLHPDHPRAPLVYIDLLATAPWNRRTKADPIRFRGCGQMMIGAAVSLSFDEGFRGRIGLHSLSGAESFYRHRVKMTEFDPDPNYQNLRYFELSEAQAAGFFNN
ncbi:hypothetical protein KZZ07_25360 [Mameliella sp. CS4]|uniref:hypothetical protein n=1 Tax=Mameliella sp. CS4 TaxID=2862329 RepID=UPI001C5FF0B8|nr:hypothetical protein [Mameliella sp. CS4]MBW4985876.1 hypothetical protein [Mameliella sp. CS4]